MNRFWGHAFSTAVLAAVAAAAFPACAHNDATLYVQGVLAPPIPTNNSCIYNPADTAVMIDRGTVDAALSGGYTPFFLLGSQMKLTANPDQVRAETGRINIQGALVRVVDPAGGATVEDATVLTAGTIQPAQGVTSGLLAISATIVNGPTIQHFNPGAGNPSKLAIAYVKFYGATLGGQTIESEEFEFPVDICYGCLVDFPAEPDVKTLSDYCSGKVPPTTGALPCVIGQDQVVDCQLCYNASPACQPNAP